jgi:hypothetical protein
MEKCKMCGKMKKASCKMCGGHSPKKKMMNGGTSSLKNVNASTNPGLAKLPTEVRNNMGYKKKGGTSPSAGLSKKEKSSVVKKATAGEDIGKKGKMFAKIAEKAGGGKKGKKIAAAAMWKNIKKTK